MTPKPKAKKCSESAMAQLPDCSEDARSGRDKSLPDWTWQLEAGDMCHGNYDKGDQHCLLGWASRLVEYSPHGTWSYLINEIRKSTGAGDEFSVAFYNDHHTLDHNARVWNTTMKRLGYPIDEGACL